MVELLNWSKSCGHAFCMSMVDTSQLQHRVCLRWWREGRWQYRWCLLRGLLRDLWWREGRGQSWRCLLRGLLRYERGGMCEKNSDDCMPCHKSWINRRIPTNRKIPTNITAGDQTKDFFFNQFAVTKILYQRFPSQEYSAVIMLSVIKLFGFLVEKTLVTGILSDSRFGLHYSGLS